ncbi:hypothetical protein RvY_19153 [Ramazzottius varieornatus]|uniref:HTH psq-type domain-containing protein n=1 Tax=Ramazzottius varieornatus TaxID=947166 RepID=A0A1D1WC37_RAMVA|nr:hypothetical protein RvY_19153 [Ramazzottius varieornatus]
MPSLSNLKTASQLFKELSMDAALHDVKNGQSLKGAARLHGVSRTSCYSIETEGLFTACERENQEGSQSLVVGCRF